MHHVLRDDGQPHWAIDGHVERIDFTLAAGMFGFPHPLLADDINVHGIDGWPEDAHVERSTPSEDEDRDAERDECPGYFERDRAVDLLRHRVRVGTVLESEEDDQECDQEREECRHRTKKREVGVHVAGDGGCLVGCEFEEGRLHI